MDTTKIAVLKDDGLLVKFLNAEYPSTEIKITNGYEALVSKTNLKEVFPVIYQIKAASIELVVLYFNCSEIKDKKYFIPSVKQEFNLLELKSFLKGVI